jgi:hypothetical protein
MDLPPAHGDITIGAPQRYGHFPVVGHIYDPSNDSALPIPGLHAHAQIASRDTPNILRKRWRKRNQKED